MISSSSSGGRRVVRFFATTSKQRHNINYFVQNKNSFLDLINTQANTATAEQLHENKLIALIDRFGSDLYGKSSEYSHGKNEFKFNESDCTDSLMIQQMLSCFMHLGHSITKVNPAMHPFIWGEREGIHIIDLEKSLYYLRKAIASATEIASFGGNVLFVTQHRMFERLAYEIALESGHFYINGPWTQGLICNRGHLLGSEKYLADLLVVLDHGTNLMPAIEADRQLIPTIAICDSNSNPDCVTYPIPANDDSYESVNLIARLLQRAVMQGSRQFQTQNSLSNKKDK